MLSSVDVEECTSAVKLATIACFVTRDASPNVWRSPPFARKRHLQPHPDFSQELRSTMFATTSRFDALDWTGGGVWAVAVAVAEAAMVLMFLRKKGVT